MFKLAAELASDDGTANGELVGSACGSGELKIYRISESSNGEIANRFRETERGSAGRAGAGAAEKG